MTRNNSLHGWARNTRSYQAFLKWSRTLHRKPVLQDDGIFIKVTKVTRIYMVQYFVTSSERLMGFQRNSALFHKECFWMHYRPKARRIVSFCFLCARQAESQNLSWAVQIFDTYGDLPGLCPDQSSFWHAVLQYETYKEMKIINIS